MNKVDNARVNIDVPDFSDEPIRPNDARIGDKLNKNQRRWAVIGISIHSIIAPALRHFVTPVFKKLYKTLKREANIKKQTYRHHLKYYPRNSEEELNYEAINNNTKFRGPDRRRKFDYAVRNEVDLSKLFLQTRMAFHTGFDHTCDLSALLQFIFKVLDSDDQKRNAKQFKEKVRNHWAHCNFDFWTRNAFNEAFDRMEKFVKSLNLSAKDEVDINRNIREWRKNGESFMTGTTLGLEVVTCTANRISDIQKHVRELAKQTKGEFVEELGMLKEIDEHMSKFGEELRTIKDTLQNHSEKIQHHEEEIQKNKKEIKNIRESVKDITEKNPCITGNKSYTIPYSRRELVGRKYFLQAIKETLLNSDQPKKKIALCGLGGIGKTAIVIEYAWMTQDEHYQGGVFWLSGQTGKAFENSIRSLAFTIGTHGGDPMETQLKTFNWISLRQDRCLIVIDNVDEDDVHHSIQECITEHVKLGQNNHVIITTRRSSRKAKVDLECSKCLTVHELSDTESVELAKTKLGNMCDENDTDIRKLCSFLHGLPLAIEQAATTLKLNRCKVSEYVNEFKEKQSIQLLNNPVPRRAINNDDKNKQSVWTTWKINIDYIYSKARSRGFDRAVDILFHLFAWLARDEITLGLINKGEPEIEDVKDIFGSIFKKREVITLFTEYSILRENSDGVLQIHPLVQEFIRLSLEVDEMNRTRMAECVLAMLTKACEEAIDNAEHIESCAILENHCVALQFHFEGMLDIVLKILHLQNLLNKKCLDLIKKDLQPVKNTTDCSEEIFPEGSACQFVEVVKLIVEQNVQGVGVCFNPESKKFDITVVSKQPNEVKREIEQLLSERSSKLPGYNLEVRQLSEEGADVTKSKEFLEFFQTKGYSKEMSKLQEIISNYSSHLMETNPNVTSISFSPVKSTGYGTPNHIIVKEPCISIFVPVKFDKKRVPFWSAGIPEIIDGIKTDVREGFLETYMQAPDTELQVGSGYLTSKHRMGTLGPFVCSEGVRTGFLTSLHLLLSPDEMKHVFSMSPNYALKVPHCSVFKANELDQPEIGKLAKVYFSTGEYTPLESGYEVGLVELASNVDLAEDFEQTNKLPNYNFNGETTVLTEDNIENRITKLGAVTGLTSGIYAGTCMFRGVLNETTSFDLTHQIGIISTQYETDNNGRYVVSDFAKPGDSGALVTVREAQTDKVIGIFSGMRSDGLFVVTPIQPICDRLKCDGWKICTPKNHRYKCATAKV